MKYFYKILLSILFITHLMEGSGGAQQCNIIYVTPGGASSGAAGTKTNPANLIYGLSLANSTSNQLWLATGTYYLSFSLAMISDVTLDGGFDPATWEKSNWNKTIISRDNTNITPNPNRIMAISCVNISNFRLQDITIQTDDATGSGVSTYGIYMDGCSGYSIVRCDIYPGDASDGSDGLPGAGGASGAGGGDGQNGDENGACCTAGGGGGGGSFIGSNDGGDGGNGGPRGSGNCPWPGGSAPSGSAGSGGFGPSGGWGGNGGQGYCQAISIGCDAGPANWGTNGVPGGNGANGSDGANGIPSFGNFFTPGDGQNGTNGTNGSGGGGGGGGGSQGCLITCFGNSNGAGPGGGGGGEGGQGGIGAAGGSGGGGSFGIFSFANTATGYIKDCFVNSGLPGSGGTGGFPGGYGGAGGVGGQGGGPGCDIGTGGDGGSGGNGGNGGNGGSGSTGISLPIYEDPNAIASNQSDMRSSAEPEIIVKSTGCTWSDIQFSTTAIGIIQWYFDGGTVPLTAVGNPVVVQYAITGRHSVTLVMDGVPYILTDFVGIFTDGTPYLPQIVSSDSVICPGSSASFGSSYAGLTYDWKVYDNTTSSYTTPTVTHTFNAPGEYLVTLQTTSSCCGKSKIDTFNMKVVPYLTADVFVSATTTSACQGEPVSFGAIPINGGTNPTFEWFVNSVSTGATGSSYSSPFLMNGDVVTCRVTSSYPCIVNSPVTSDPITITINPLPAFMCNATGQYLGAKTTFSTIVLIGSPPFTYLWSFGDGSYDTSAAPAHLYGGTGQYTFDVAITDGNGCRGTCIGIIDIVIPPYVYAGFDTNNVIMICNQTSVNFTDTTQGNPTSWLWDFGDNSTSTQQNPSHTYTSPGAYTVTLIAGNGIYSDTAIYPNHITVLPSPTAGLSARERYGCKPVTTQFMDESLGATSWLWDFGDGSQSTLQNPSHTFTTEGYYDITLTVGNNYGCYSTIVMNDYITVFPKPVADFTESDHDICIEEFIVFTDQSINAIKWTWSFGDGDSDLVYSSPVHTYYEPGLYTVWLMVENIYGCTDTIEKKDLIYVWPKPIPDFTSNPNPTIILSPEITFTDLTQNEPVLWWWYFGDGETSVIQNPVHTYQDTGKYYVELVVENTWGCRDSTTDSVQVFPEYTFFIPNTFTPNGDAINDLFIPKFVGLMPEYFEFYIFNRWGQLVFETRDPDKGWDGEMPSGRTIMMDVYAWRIYTVDILGNRHQYVGHVTVRR